VTEEKSAYPEPPSYSSLCGEDQHGAWCDISIQNVVQRFRQVSAGEFLMGTAKNELGNTQLTETQHKVVLTKGFWIADTTVSQLLWHTVMGDNPSRFKGDNLPVDGVSWHDASRFLESLRDTFSDPLINLPTEAQWEYACRADTLTPFSFGECITSDHANIDGSLTYNGSQASQDRQTTIDAKLLPSNNWGIYGMHGNVWEWCYDWYVDDYSKLPSVDPVGTTASFARSLRGGSWFYSAQHCRSATRGHDAPESPGILMDYWFRVIINS